MSPPPTPPAGTLEVERRPLSTADRALLEARAEVARSAVEARVRALGPRWAPWAGAVALVLVALWVVVAAGLETPGRALVASVAGSSAFLTLVALDLRIELAHRRAVLGMWARILAQAERDGTVELRVTATRAVVLEHDAWLLAIGDGWWLYAELPWDAAPSAPARRFRWLRIGGLSIVESDGPLLADERAEAPELADDHPLADRWGPAVFRAGDDPVAGLQAFAEGFFPIPTEPRGSS